MCSRNIKMPSPFKERFANNNSPAVGVLRRTMDAFEWPHLRRRKAHQTVDRFNVRPIAGHSVVKNSHDFPAGG